MVYNILNMDIVLKEMHRFATGGLCSPPVLIWTDALLKNNTHSLPL